MLDRPLPYVLTGKRTAQMLVEVLQREDGVFVVNLPALLIIDYDLPSDRHLSRASVLGISYEHLVARLQAVDALWGEYHLPVGPAQWRIHATAGGLHAFRMDAPIPMSENAANFLKDTKICDPGYISLAKNTKTWPIRVSKKNPEEKQVYKILHKEEHAHEACAVQIAVYEQLVRKHGDE